MGLVLLAVRRLVAQRALAATMVATFAFTGGVLVAAPIYAAGAEQAIVFGYVERAPALSRDLITTLTTPPGFDIGGADAQLRALLSPIAVERLAFQERSSTFTATSSRGSVPASLAYRDGLISRVGLTDGRYPVADDEVLLPQSIASALGVGPEGSFTVRYSSPVTVRVVGIYASIPASASFIVGQTSAAAKAPALPILTTSEGFPVIVGAAGQSSGLRIAWDAKPDVRGATLTGLASLAQQEHRVAAAISSALGASVSSNLASLIPGVRREIADSRAPIYLVVLQVAMVGLGVSIGVGSLKLRRQSFELSILKTRGARTGFLVAVQAAELVLTAAIGWVVALGAGMAMAFMARAAHGPGAPGAPFGLSLGAPAELIGLAGIVLAAAALLLLSLPHIRRSVLDERREVSRERRPAWLRYPAEILPLSLGVVALTELRRRGIQPSGVRLDPLVLVAPTLILLGASLLAVRVLFWGFGRSERLADHTGTPSAFLAIHRLSRSSANMSLMLLLVLSTGLFAFSSSLRSTVLDHNTNAARGTVGADWSYLVPFPDDEARSVADLPSDATLVFKAPVNTTDDPRFAASTVIGVDPATYPSGGWWRPGDSTDPFPSLLARLKAPPLGERLPAGTSTVEIRATVAADAPPGVHIWAPLSFPDGAVRAADLGALRAGTQTYRTPTNGASRVLSVMLAAPDPAPVSLVRAGGFAVTFERLAFLGSPSGATAPLSDWRGLQATGLIVTSTATPEGFLRAEFRVAGGGPIGGIAPTNLPLPAIVGTTAAPPLSSVGLDVGFTGLSVRSVGVVRGFPAIRSSDTPVIVPLAPLIQRFEQILQAPNGGVFEVLAMGDTDPTAGIRGAGFSIGTVSRAADIEATLATSPQNLALGMEFAAGVAGATLAVMALGSALFFGAHRRRYELSSLRALGGRPRHAVAALALEYGLILVPATALGYVMGTVLLRIVLAFVSPPVAGTGPALLVIDWAGAALATIAGLLTLAFGLTSAARQMRSPEASLALRGEPE
ncbi:MAG: putative transport system permease protein [Actinomycetota bacterium]|jgi:hypothetical protein|nr:putative transport system permease protein [Actinomycetota bacterium]